MLKPKILTTLQSYNREHFFHDLAAGLIVGVVAIPLAIAFGIASGVSPEKGIITAIIAGFIISALGGSRVQIGGPTGAFVVIIYGIIEKYGLNGLMTATIMAGVILIIFGLARFGSMIKYIPHPVISGFTSGIAIIIFLSQVKDFLGLRMGSVPAEFFEKMSSYFGHLGDINYYAVGISILTLLIILVGQRFFKKIPGSLIALIVSTIIVSLFKLPVETIGSRFGEISAGFPAPTLPKLDFQTIKSLISPAITIAILAAIEALLSAVVADGMIGGKHRSDMELVANGVANIFSPIFGGIPATGAIARTATNIKNGGRTPIAGIIHAVVLLLIMLFFGKWVSFIPLSCLAAILVIVSYNMSEWRSFLAQLKSPGSDVIVLLLTFSLTIIFDLTVAIEVGLLISLLFFMRRMSMVTNVNVVTDEFEEMDENDQEEFVTENRIVPKGVEVYEINGPLFFGAAYKFEEAINGIEKRPKVMIILMGNVPAIDSTGIHTLRQILKQNKRHNMSFIISGLKSQPYEALEQVKLLETIGKENICENIDQALKRAKEIVDLQAAQISIKKDKVAAIVQ